jgi:hypothetical protein
MFDEAWRYVDAFRVDQAAALWADENPAKFDHQYAADAWNRVNAYKQMLAGAIASGKLQADQSTNGLRVIGNYDASIVTREALIDYAREHNKSLPAFLFDTVVPEIDGDQELDEQKASKKKRGRPPEYDYNLMYAKIVLIAHKGELPETQARLVNDLLLWFSIDPTDDTKELKPPSERLVEDRVRPIYNNLKRLGWSPVKPTNSRR